ncbi:PucR family transcriptional regulator [Streptomyces shenzhenensis]|uniref:PucR family transcriptional regulator n=1 Tax=Streptomyces shenzhenensis TaxID=943815 RepID=UPI0033D7AE9E
MPDVSAPRDGSRAPQVQTVTVADILSLIGAEDVTLLSDSRPDTPAERVVLLSTETVQRHARGLDSEEAGVPDLRAAVVVFETDLLPGRAEPDYLADIAVRLCADQHAALLVLLGATGLAASTRALAERYALPVASVVGSRRSGIIARIEIIVTQPLLRHHQAVWALTSRLTAQVEDLAQILQSIADVTGGIAAVQSGSRLVQAALPMPAEPGSPMLYRPLPVRRSISPYTSIENGRSTAVTPVPLPESLSDQHLLLVVQHRGGGPLWRGIALDVLAAARSVVSAWAINDLLTSDRLRFRWSTMLQQVIDSPIGLPHALLADADEHGWALESWHLAIHLHCQETGQLPSAELTELDLLLREAEIPCTSLIPRPRGAACWVSAPELALLPAPQQLAAQVNEALEFYQASNDSVQVTAGIGAPHSGAQGLGPSLEEARRAALLPQNDSALPHVRLGERQAVDRILALWEADPLLRREAGNLLAPLDGAPVLLATLAAYLESGSSRNATARILAIHRNTVHHRLERIERLLNANLTDHTTQMALSVALHLADPAPPTPSDGM